MALIHAFLIFTFGACSGKHHVSQKSTALLVQQDQQTSETERWRGRLELANGSLELIVDFKRIDQKWSAVLHVPSQGVSSHALQAIRYEQDAFHFEIHKQAKTHHEIYDCVRTQDSAECTLQMADKVFQMSMKKSNDINASFLASDKRIQKPTPPYPYESIDLSHTSPVDDSPRTGTLTIPKGDGPFPAIVIESGSGTQDRDGNIMGHAFYHVLADMLSRQKVAVYRVDDRGKGGSVGDPWVGYDDLAQDLGAAVSVLKKQPKINPNQIGLLGHSQGAAIATKSALLTDDISFLVLLGGPGIQGDRLMIQQKGDALKAAGIQGDYYTKRMTAYKALMQTIVEEGDDSAVEKSLQTLFDVEIPPAFRKAMPEGQFESLLAQTKRSLTSKPMRDLVCYKPSSHLSKIKIPVLAIFGSKDTQVAPRANHDGMTSIFKQSGNTTAKVMMVDGMNHVFQPAKTGLVEEYKTIDITVMPKLPQLISSWVHAQH